MIDRCSRDADGINLLSAKLTSDDDDEEDEDEDDDDDDDDDLLFG